MFGLKRGFKFSGQLQYGKSGKSFAVESGRMRLVLGKQHDCLTELEIREKRPLEFFMHIVNCHDGDQPDIVGAMEDGTPVKASWLAMGDNVSMSPTMTFSAGEATIGPIRPCAKIRLFFPNLKLAVKHDLIQVGPQGFRSVKRPWHFQFPEPLDKYLCQLHLRRDLKDIKVDKHSNIQYRLTGVLDITAKSGQLVDWAEVEEAIYRLCNLFSLAKGQQVNWLVAQGSDPGTISPSWWLYRRHTISEWNGKGAIIPVHWDRHSFVRLMECWPTIIRFTDVELLAFRRAIHLLLHSGPTYSFPVPFYCCGGAFEILYAVFFEGRNNNYITDKPTAKQVRKAFKDWAEKSFLPAVEPYLVEEIQKRLDTKFDHLNSRFLYGKIVTMAKELMLRFDESVVARFVELRNDAAHGLELTEQDTQELFLTVTSMEDLLARLMLRLINYRGQYWGNQDGWGTMMDVE